RLAHMLLKAAERGQGERAARVAALVGDRGLGGADVDLRHRLDRFGRDGGPAARAGRDLAARWARDAGGGAGADELSDGGLLSLAFPERVARARGAPGEFLMANGRGAFLEATDALARERWLAVGELGGGERRDRILLAAPLEEAEVLGLFADQLSEEDRVEATGGRTRAKRLTRLGRIVVGERLLDDPAAVAAALAGEVRAKGLGDLPFGEATRQLRHRAALAGLNMLSDERLLAELDAWLTPLLEGRGALSELGAGELDTAVRALVDWNSLKQLDAEAPTHWTTPAGSRLPIDYGAEGGPRVEVRPQELFGLDRHPAIAGGSLPLTLALTSPAHRPIQVTRDLPGFWRGSWKEVRAEMRGRYPKHPWPEDPLIAAPTTRVKPRA
ncbi:MAG: ATP-dependent helicase HrpB, partial [Caulobacteraceae bacterium]|nr:ATP-dependent helicase HrpB [Caulobacteraceae bacterium]